MVKDDLSDSCKFIIFKSIIDILFFIYIKNDNSIISYDRNKKINEIINAHYDKIDYFIYHLDIKNKKDLIFYHHV